MGANTYLALSAGILASAAAVALVAARVRGRTERPARLLPSVAAAAAALVLLTAVFDNVMIAVGLFEYADSVISGLRLGLAPIEDFAYPVAAVILLPSLWILFAPLRRDRSDDDH